MKELSSKPFVDANSADSYWTPSADQLHLLELLWSAFTENGEWPLFHYVDEVLAERGLISAQIVRSLARPTLPSYGPVWWDSIGYPRRESTIGATVMVNRAEFHRGSFP